ncbi:trypsin-like peptidase domain-containing protein [Paraconexibacter antarcticus]|uniref:Trypsin-like peptidase domain-containing protein n=1 Tax=Paraconexibacter antarcticus TaxID=2949664 RepID=A0ABY5DSA7_9ACTN|nr:trypsin-like peptidase domain-containing protein [Paraconexibacter antarcticus]UTI64908.1 trypsin-like peptidase domain-containing protein [Paraconexibacter antarcticus]
MPSPRHLWSGPWRDELSKAPSGRRGDAPDPDVEEDAAAEAPTRAQPAVGAAPPRVAVADAPPPPPYRRAIVAGLVAGTVGVIAAGGYLIGTHDDRHRASTTAALPALPSTPIKPKAGESRATKIYALASPAVVSIRTGTGEGTGFLVKDRQTIATNAHVVDNAKTVTVRFGPTGRDITAEVKGTDPSSDLAVVKLPAGSAPADAKPLQLADSSAVRVGDQVVAIGNPFGLDRTLTEGIISGLARAIPAPNNYEIDDALQTDAAINPGNSGGPLLDTGGKVIGVNSQIETGGSSSGQGGNIGIGFAVTSNTVRQVIPALAKGKRIDRAWLGITSQPSASGTGATLTQTTPGGPAEAGGLVSGDVILSIDGDQIREFSDISRIVNAHQPGDKITVKVRRDTGEVVDRTITLGVRPATTP